MAFKKKQKKGDEGQLGLGRDVERQLRKVGLLPKHAPKKKVLDIRPQAGPQLDAIMATWCPELFFGGARGGGKSIFLLMDFLQDVQRGWGREWVGTIFRKSYPELKQLIDDSHRIYGKVPGAVYFKKEREWIFKDGEKLEFRFLDREEDVRNYQGFARQWLGFDELPNWPSLAAYDMMKATLRPTGKCGPLRIRSTGNPGGPGHSFVKQRFIDWEPKGYKPYDPDGKGERMFIPSKVWDNKILLDRDPGYIKRLEQSGPDFLVKAWLDGDWEVVMGSFFDVWSPDRHIVATAEVPQHWFRFRSFDWGGHAPFSVGWWAVSDGVCPLVSAGGEQYFLPKGAKVRYREWYGCDERDYKKGIGLDNEEIAKGILRRTPSSERMEFTVTDNLPFQRRGGPTIAEVFDSYGVPLLQGDTDRVSGCAALYHDLKGGTEGVPMMYFMDNCPHAIRQIPIAQIDDKKREQYKQSNDDHALDEVKLTAKVRDYVNPVPKDLPSEQEKLQNSLIVQPTLSDLIAFHLKKVEGGSIRSKYGI